MTEKSKYVGEFKYNHSIIFCKAFFEHINF